MKHLRSRFLTCTGENYKTSKEVIIFESALALYSVFKIFKLPPGVGVVVGGRIDVVVPEKMVITFGLMNK